MRISSALGCLALLAACGSESPSPPGDAFDCAIGAGSDFSSDCTLERTAGELVLHHPDGGFRRVARDPGTGALTVIDGSEPLVPEAGAAEAVQFTIGSDRYRIPLVLLDEPS